MRLGVHRLELESAVQVRVRRVEVLALEPVPMVVVLRVHDLEITSVGRLGILLQEAFLSLRVDGHASLPVVLSMILVQILRPLAVVSSAVDVLQLAVVLLSALSLVEEFLVINRRVMVVA